MVRRFPPVAADIPSLEALKAIRFSGKIGEDYEALRSFLNVTHVFGVCSGRSGLYAILKAALPRGATVILPGYTCFTVAAAVVKAGFRPILCDSSPDNLGYDPASLRAACEKNDNIGAVVVCHLFGIPVDVQSVRDIVGPDVLLIDDAAQALGIRIGDRMLGTHGDCGLYSFGRGKNLAASGGGLIVTGNGELAEKIKSTIEGEFANRTGSLTEILSAVLYNAATAPSGYGIVSRLPGVRIGQTIYDPDFSLGKLDRYRCHLVKRLLTTLERLTLERQQVAEAYESNLEGKSGIAIPRSTLNGMPGNLRFPVLLEPGRRAKLLSSTRAARFGISGMYPSPLAAIRDLPTFADYTTEGGSGQIANSLLTLPTHRGIRKAGPELMRRIVDLL
jgi:perosamine synthetase